jgi:hypothetical protein
MASLLVYYSFIIPGIIPFWFIILPCSCMIFVSFYKIDCLPYLDIVTVFTGGFVDSRKIKPCKTSFGKRTHAINHRLRPQDTQDLQKRKCDECMGRTVYL